MLQRGELALTWQGPFKLSDFIGNPELERQFGCPGVYIWIEKLEKADRLSYVGRAKGSRTLCQRQKQHYANMIGGLYTIPHEFYAADCDWVPDWSRQDIYTVLLNPEEFHKLVDAGFAYADACEVHLCGLTSGNEAQQIERQLLYDLQPTGTTWGTRTPPGNPIR